MLDVVTRKEWEALPPTGELEPLIHPAENVVYTHSLDVEQCHSDAECKARVQELQKKHLDSGFADILYNFVIGGNGKAYEGRGWWKQPDKSLRFPELHGKRVDIAYLGSYGKDELPSDEMINIVDTLISYATDVDYVKPFHNERIIC